MKQNPKSRTLVGSWQDILWRHASWLIRGSERSAHSKDTAEVHRQTEGVYMALVDLLEPQVTNVLFICSANRLRSPTAEQVFSTWPGIETDSAGISNDASVLLSTEQVDWADIIFVMEKTHRNKLNRKFRSSLNGKRVICLDIPDDYEFMDPVLVRMLESRVGRFLSRSESTAPKP